MDINGQNLAQLTSNDFDDYAPKWSPDGKKIVFISNRNSHIDSLYIMDADGSNQTHLNTKPGDIPTDPEWSPDGRQIVFATNTQHLFILNLETGTLTELASDMNVLSPSWSPDGKKLVFAYFSILNLLVNGIEIINQDGTDKTELKVRSARGMPGITSWAPDGTKIAFGKIGIQYNSIDLGPFRQIAQQSGIQQILEKLQPGPSYTYLTFTMRPDGSDVQQITDQCSGGEWSPDGQWLICASKENGNNDLYIVNVSSGNLFRLTDTSYNEIGPDWSP